MNILSAFDIFLHPKRATKISKNFFHFTIPNPQKKLKLFFATLPETLFSLFPKSLMNYPRPEENDTVFLLPN